MRRVERQRRAAVEELFIVKLLIEAKFGQDVIREAYSRLCNNCKRQSKCNLLPITTTGEDCPYFPQWGRE